MTEQDYIQLISGSADLTSGVISGLNPVGNYTSKQYSNANDILALAQMGYNSQNVYNKYNTLGTIGSTTASGASIGSVGGPIGTAIGAAAGAIVGGVTSIFGSKNMKNKTNLANRTTAANFANRNLLLESNNLLNAKMNPMNQAAYGGLMQLNVGGKHEQNTYGGVPFSKSGDTINGAEEGETITKDHNSNRIYSNRLKLTDEVVRLVGLDKSLVGKTPAEATKYYNNKFIIDKVDGKDSKLLMDNIRRNALLPKLDDIFMAQELLKNDKQKDTNQYANGGVLLRNTKNRFFVMNNILEPFGKGGSIYIKPSKRGTFKAAATKHGMGVQAFAAKVLANKEDYSPAMIKKANFARNAAKWNALGDETPELKGTDTHIYGTSPDIAHIDKRTKSSFTENNYMRYSPVLGNLLQNLQLAMETPEEVRYERVSTPQMGQPIYFKPIDARPYQQQIERGRRNIAQQLREASAGNRAQYMSSVLGSDLAYTGKSGEIQAQLDDMNWQRRINAINANNALLANYNQQLMQAQQFNSVIALQESDTNARNRAALANARRLGFQTSFENLGAIGSEQDTLRSLERIFGYNKNLNRII